MRCSLYYLSDKEILAFAKKAMELVDYPQIVAIAHRTMQSYAENLPMGKLHQTMVSMIEEDDLYDEMELCRDCGHIPETGACNYCKQD